jgi:SpoVK/Ycf46/Vps4 family AAA+-type ATPase
MQMEEDPLVTEPRSRTRRPSSAAAAAANALEQDNDLEDDQEEEEEPEPEEEDISDAADDLEPSESSEEEDDDDEDDNHRYSRRVRQTVQRFTPGRPKRETRRSGRHHRSSLDDIGQVAQPGEHFSQRYSSRNRRTVDRFNPVANDGGQQRTSGGGRTSGGRRDSSRAAKRARREGVDFHSSDEEEEDDEPTDSDLDLEDEEGDGRRTYSFRDRAQVTIKPTTQQQGGGGGGGNQDRFGGDQRRSKDPPRRRTGGGGGGGGRNRFNDADELPFTQGFGAGNGVGGGGGGAATTPGGTAAAPWMVALNALGLGPGAGVAGAGGNQQQPNATIAAAGGVRGGPGGAPNNASLEITPLEVDSSVSFDHVGGLEHYVRALKEMVFLPLVYPELFERFHVTPPRGVLFYGPPGTGKTLVARALAAHASKAAGGRKVSFFMRKGADVLSKWVGESERQLRMLFEEARRHQPSIIFFDEIDGLAPVRSSRSDQIHNSIVSTLLALMDGLDPRGQVVIIGATNRVDALDGALRRPGRFDRELLFPLPGQQARNEILKIHTKKWSDPPTSETLEELAGACVGYCGADLKALCTEASLAALRRRYPQIYDSEHKLMIDPGQVRVEKTDFFTAFKNITPASHRAAASPGRPLPPAVGPALLSHLQAALGQLQRVFPPAAACLRDGGGARPGGAARALGGLASLCLQRPRLLIAGPPGCGQAHLGPALLYALEGLQTHSIGLPSLLSDVGARSPEEALVHAVAEARRAAPAVLYLPHLQAWWDTAPGSLRATLWALLADLPPDLPLLLLASADVEPSDLDPEARALFGGAAGEGIYTLTAPTHDERIKFFEPVSTALIIPPPDDETTDTTSTVSPEALPLAPEALAAEEAAIREAAALAARKKYEEDQSTFRTLRMSLRWVLDRLLQARRWEAYYEPVDPEEDPKYWEIVTQPMDLSTLLSRVDQRRYSTPAQFLADVALIPAGERQYWEDLPAGVKHISRACALEDEARALVDSAVPVDLRAKLEGILAAGGPAPPPEGLHVAMGLLEDGTMPQPEATRQQHNKQRNVSFGGAGGSGLHRRGDEDGQRRTTARLAGDEIDARIIHVDPEAQLRRIKALKRGETAAAATAAAAAEAEAEDAGSEEQEGKESAPQKAEDLAGSKVLAPLADNVVQDGVDDQGAAACKPTEENVTATTTAAAAAKEAVIVTPEVAPKQQPEITAAQKNQILALQGELATHTDKLNMESLEEINAQLGRVAWERRGEVDRIAVRTAALEVAEELSRKLT